MAFSKQLAGRILGTGRTVKVPVPLRQRDAEYPAVLVRHCGEENPAFYNAWSKRSIARGPSPATRERLQREIDAPIIGEFGIAGFEHIYEDESATPCEFSTAKAIEFMLALAESPDDFDLVRNYCLAAHMFRDPIPAAEDVGKG